MLSPFALLFSDVVVVPVVGLLSAGLWVEVCSCQCWEVRVWVLLVVEEEVEDECVVVEGSVVDVTGDFVCTVLCGVV